MAIPLGLFLGGIIVAIPVVTGVAEGVSHQRKQNEEAANETRMVKFNILTACEATDEVDNGIVVLRHDKLWILPSTLDTAGKPTPVPPNPHMSPPLHPFAGFYIQYPDDERSPPQRGLVSTISDDPPMLNWIYVHNSTYALSYGNRTASIAHVVGEWDWTSDESAVMLEGWEGFVAVDESCVDGWADTEAGKEGLRWALYFDRDDDGLRGKKGDRRAVEVVLKRRLQSAEDQLRQLEEADKKMQVKSEGGMKSQFTAPALEKKKAVWGKK